MQLSLARPTCTLAFLLVVALTASCRDSTIPENPTPGIQLISPSAVLHGTADQPLTIQGTDFVEESEVWVAGHQQPTTYVSSRELRATIAAEDLLAPGQKSVHVS